jgi:hypothetical protein
MRFHGAVGYASSQETSPGVWQDIITERTYYGDVTMNARHLLSPQMVPPFVNADISLENSFSILADAHAYENFLDMRYVVWEGSYWQITKVEVKRPRLILTIGGIWNGVKA